MGGWELGGLNEGGDGRDPPEGKRETVTPAAVSCPACALHVPGRKTTEPALALTPW